MSPDTIYYMRKKDKSLEEKRLLLLSEILKRHPGGLWIRELARRAKLHSETTRRIIASHPDNFLNYADFTKYRVNLRIIKLKRRF